jgi:copper homeostasis protein
MVRIEVCVETAGDARNAEAAGAERVELCAALSEGGVTPSLGAVRRARTALARPLVVLLRPRGGDFCWSEEEVATMQADLELLRAEGVEAVALGALTPDGALDQHLMARLIAAARPLEVVLHRAIDHARDLEAAWEAASALGCARVLTSGGAAHAWAGRAQIARLVGRSASGGARIVAAGGISPENVGPLVAATGVEEIHLSASALQPGSMRYRPDIPAMRSAPLEHEAERRGFCARRLAAVLEALR